MRKNVNDIRSDEYTELLKQANLEDENWFSENRHRFVDGKCPVCDTREHSTLLPPSRFGAGINVPPYRRCDKCHTVFLDRHLDEAGYADYYTNSRLMRVFSQYVYPNSLENRKKMIYKPRLERMLEIVKKYGSSEGSNAGVYLEIGAGTGAFAKLAQESECFSDVYALEPNPYCAADCRNAGLKVIEKGVKQLSSFPENTRACAMFECVAHLYDPASAIEEISKKLPDGALFIITTPNCLGFDVQELGTAASSFGHIYVHVFNPGSLKTLLEKKGFEVVDMATPGILDVDLVRRKYAAASEEELAGSSPWLKNLLLNGDEKTLDAFQKFIAENLLSSHLWIVGRKKKGWLPDHD